MAERHALLYLLSYPAARELDSNQRQADYQSK
jgi:hypothetical protein